MLDVSKDIRLNSPPIRSATSMESYEKVIETGGSRSSYMCVLQRNAVQCNVESASVDLVGYSEVSEPRHGKQQGTQAATLSNSWSDLTARVPANEWVCEELVCIRPLTRRGGKGNPHHA